MRFPTGTVIFVVFGVAILTVGPVLQTIPYVLGGFLVLIIFLDRQYLKHRGVEWSRHWWAYSLFTFFMPPIGLLYSINRWRALRRMNAG